MTLSHDTVGSVVTGTLFVFDNHNKYGFKVAKFYSFENSGRTAGRVERA